MPCLLSVVALLAASVAHAKVTDSTIEAARMCTEHFPKFERIHGIPTHLLAAISSVESGRWNDTVKMALPWPWTINANGQSYYLDSKAEAVKKAKSLLLQGIRSVDVGCMQVNLKHHPTAFVTLDQAFDPERNVAYAARFLRENYEETRSWTRATAAYHSKTPKYGKKYLARIEDVWSKIVGRVRKARSNQGIAKGEYAVNVSKRQAEQQFAALEREFAELDSDEAQQGDVSFPQEREARQPSSKPEMKVADLRESPKKAKPRTSMRIIELSAKDVRQEPGNVMVIRPSAVKAQAEADEERAARTDRRMASVRNELFVMGSQAPADQSTRQELSLAAPSREDDALRRPNFVFVD